MSENELRIFAWDLCCLWDWHHILCCMIIYGVVCVWRVAVKVFWSECVLHVDIEVTSLSSSLRGKWEIITKPGKCPERGFHGNRTRVPVLSLSLSFSLPPSLEVMCKCAVPSFWDLHSVMSLGDRYCICRTYKDFIYCSLNLTCRTQKILKNVYNRTKAVTIDLHWFCVHQYCRCEWVLLLFSSFTSILPSIFGWTIPLIMHPYKRASCKLRW